MTKSNGDVKSQIAAEVAAAEKAWKAKEAPRIAAAVAAAKEEWAARGAELVESQRAAAVETANKEWAAKEAERVKSQIAEAVAAAEKAWAAKDRARKAARAEASAAAERARSSEAAEVAAREAERATSAASEAEDAATADKAAAGVVQGKLNLAVEVAAKAATAATAAKDEAKQAKEAEDAAAAAADEAAAEASAAATAAKAALTPSPVGEKPSRRIGWREWLGVWWFGAALGLLTSLTTAAGITVTLVGLLFTFVGASLLSWFKKDEISADDRSTIAAYTGAVGAGLVAGLFVGFGCRFLEEGWIRPFLMEQAGRPLKKLQDEVADVRARLEKLGPDVKPPPDRWKEMISEWKRIEDLLAQAGGGAKSPSDRSITRFGVLPPPRYVLDLQADEKDKILGAANAVEDVLNWDADPDNKDKLTLADRQTLKSFGEALRKADPRVHLSPQLWDAVGEMLNRKPKSPISGEPATTLQSLFTPSTP